MCVSLHRIGSSNKIRRSTRCSARVISFAERRYFAAEDAWPQQQRLAKQKISGTKPTSKLLQWRERSVPCFTKMELLKTHLSFYSNEKCFLFFSFVANDAR